MTATTFQRVTKPAPRAITIGDRYYPKGAPVTICKNYKGCLKDPTEADPKATWEDYVNIYNILPGEKAEVEIPVDPATMTSPCSVTLKGKNIDCLIGAIDKEPQVPTPDAPVLDGAGSQNVDVTTCIDITGAKVLCLFNKGSEPVCPELHFGD